MGLNRVVPRLCPGSPALRSVLTCQQPAGNFAILAESGRKTGEEIMGRLQRVLCRALGLTIGALMLLAVFTPTPSLAQVMHDDGFALPWFHSRSQQMARRACEDELPECRESVRRQLATEKTITTIAPWVLLCLFMLGTVIYVRRREARREERRHQAERHHIREAHRAPRTPRDGADEPAVEHGADDDDMGFGHPGDRR
jgi:hypothetical protein